MASQHHFILIVFPIQGHINPALQLAKRLIDVGALVTFSTSTSGKRCMSKETPFKGLSLTSFSDGSESSNRSNELYNGDINTFMPIFRNQGSIHLRELIEAFLNDNLPVTCVLYSLLLPWASKVARSFHVPSVLSWMQPATVLDIYYYYFHGYGDIIKKKFHEPSWSIELPALPLLTSHDLPSFLNPKDTFVFGLPTYDELLLQTLDEETKPIILVNTFDALEPEALRAIDKYRLIGIGPLIPLDILDPKHMSNDCVEWLNSKPESSVIYVSFGSLAVLSKQQKEEIARSLLECQHPFLWILRGSKDDEEKKEAEISGIEELDPDRRGMIVPWCSQVEVLSHASVGCFVTHCGWNSTLESLVSGVPMVACPQWADQGTNTKLVEDVWKIGVRAAMNEEGIVECDEITRCLELVMGDGERGEEMRKNAEKWKHLAVVAVKEGGSSECNLWAFINEIAINF